MQLFQEFMRIKKPSSVSLSVKTLFIPVQKGEWSVQRVRFIWETNFLVLLKKLGVESFNSILKANAGTHMCDKPDITICDYK